LAAARRELSEGAEVVVVSPRPGAAHFHFTMTGARAALMLYLLGRRVRADELVLCMEPGVPFRPGASGIRARLEAALLEVSLRRFRRVSLLVCGELAVDPSVLHGLWSVAQEVVVGSEKEMELATEVLGAPPSSVVVRSDRGRRGEIVAAEEGDEGFGARAGERVVTVSGPPEWGRDERARHLVAVLEDGARLVKRAAVRIVR
jgi:hypothetical protein